MPIASEDSGSKPIILAATASIAVWSALARITFLVSGSMIRGPAPLPAVADSGGCSSGAHTLSKYGDRVYPEMGNGGYTSVHSDITIVYDTATNMFLPGTHVDLTQQATQCLTDFSLDFERTSANTTEGPNMTVNSVAVNGQPAMFTFVQPTYPGQLPFWSHW